MAKTYGLFSRIRMQLKRDKQQQKQLELHLSEKHGIEYDRQ